MIRLQRIALLASIATILTGCGTPPGRGVVALLSDYGNRDHYVGVLTGKVLSANPNARIVAITNGIAPYDVVQGAFVLSQAVPEFPAGTVVLAIVDPGAANRQAIVAITQSGHILVGPDNGLFDLVLRREKLQSMYLIENAPANSDNSLDSFPGREMFAPIAGYLSLGGDPSKVGPLLSDWIRIDMDEPKRSEHGFAGGILHVDRFGNILTNIPGAWLKESPVGAAFELTIGDHSQRCTRQNAYGEVARGEFLMLENEGGTVEIARNMDNAAEALGGRTGVAVTIRKLATK